MIRVFEKTLEFLLEPESVRTYHIYSDYLIKILMENGEDIYKQYKQKERYRYTCEMNINDNGKLHSISYGDSYLPAATIISANKKYRIDIYLFNGEINPDYKYMDHYVLDDTYVRFKKDNETRILHISPTSKVEYKYNNFAISSITNLDD